MDLKSYLENMHSINVNVDSTMTGWLISGSSHQDIRALSCQWKLTQESRNWGCVFEQRWLWLWFIGNGLKLRNFWTLNSTVIFCVSALSQKYSSKEWMFQIIVSVLKFQIRYIWIYVRWIGATMLGPRYWMRYAKTLSLLRSRYQGAWESPGVILSTWRNALAKIEYNIIVSDSGKVNSDKHLNEKMLGVPARDYVATSRNLKLNWKESLSGQIQFYDGVIQSWTWNLSLGQSVTKVFCRISGWRIQHQSTAESSLSFIYFKFDVNDHQNTLDMLANCDVRELGATSVTKGNCYSSCSPEDCLTKCPCICPARKWSSKNSSKLAEGKLGINRKLCEGVGSGAAAAAHAVFCWHWALQQE
jgi:hypothetical protein